MDDTLMSPPPQPGRSRAALVIAGAIAAGDVPELCERLRVLLTRCDAEIVICDVGAVHADAVTVDALARLQLTACRFGSQIRLRRVSRELAQLLAFAGLEDVLPTTPGLDG
ncbi:MAG TPA: STAS domain-containing protein [Solirubrobacteraceae bacterium]|jgi:ABC-type transporter Mla MlaB component